MSIVLDKYNQLKPEFHFLYDEAVLAQAWKKSHTYIRSYNWYADTLELDCSAVNLEKRIKKWAEQLQNKIYVPSRMRLIPAPKADHWAFYIKDDTNPPQWNWGPCPKRSDKIEKVSIPKELRPLAHLNIQDQTIATAIMLCLADAVETKQGRTNPVDGYNDDHSVWSYGNRLFCKWEGKQAHFSWGNSNTYSKYFQDYQLFLERPINIAKRKQLGLGADQVFYIIHLDLSSFYDSINRDHLISVLKDIADKHYVTDEINNNEFWESVKQIINGWEWEDQDKLLKDCLKELPIKKGLPQGLVASGFFANAYLIELDEKMGSLIGNEYDDVTLDDYCRYVDDIRLLVHVPANKEPECWKEWVKCNLQRIIEKTTKGIELNPGKTKVERYTAKRSGVSVRMKAIQEAASGPQDSSALNEMLSSLEGLFAMAEQFRDQDGQDLDTCELPLAKIDQPQMDVRDDTLLRFTANRITKALADKRLLTSQDNIGNDGISELDHVHESIARRFVAAWSRNPALVLVLKKGLSLFPHQQLLRPVLEALLSKVNPSKSDSVTINEKRIALYCLAEIFRFSALELQRQKPGQRPKHADWEGFKSLLSYNARDLLKDTSLPWYVQQQIVLYCTVCEEKVCLPKLGESNEYRLLLCALCGNHPFETEDEIDKRVTAFVIGFQMYQDKATIVSSLGSWLNWLYANNRICSVEMILDEVAVNCPILFNKLLIYGEQIKVGWYEGAEAVCHKYGLDSLALQGELIKQKKTWIPLSSVILRNDNPFAHENALLALAIAAIHFIEKDISNKFKLLPHLLEISCSDWKQIQHLNPSDIAKFLILKGPENSQIDVRYVPPSWLSACEESCTLYQLGSFLRACIIGSLDFTSRQFLMREDTSHGYFGFKSSWYKRRMGMANQPEALNGDAAPMTLWVSELLYRLLQWPGLEVQVHADEWPTQLTLVSIKKKLHERLKKQLDLYGSASDLPVYVLKVHHDLKNEQLLHVVMVQSLLPRKEDFNSKDIQFDDPNFRARHREHIATMTCLVLDKLKAVKQADGEKTIKPLADLIVFPELSVHPNDIVLLKQLADKTGAMIFAGLTYLLRDGDSINTALWLIPFTNGHGRQWIKRLQGKQHLTAGENKLKIKNWRPYQLVIELANTLQGQPNGFRLSGAICYDATNISLAADLKDITNAFVVPALNSDIDTFDTMVDALHYHMYQPVILVNSGEFGGSAAKAPYKEKYDKRIAHVHGTNQIAVSMFELNMYDFGKKLQKLGSGKEMKTPPAGLARTK